MRSKMKPEENQDDEKRDQFEFEGHEGGEEIFPLHGDLLEITLSYVPLIDLIAASCVSKSWNRAVSSSLTHIRRVKPWLLVHSHSHSHIRRRRASDPIITHAFDPQSKIWIEISPDDGTQLYGGSLHSSGSDFLYDLTSTTLSFSHNDNDDDDPLHLTTWRGVPGPTFSRIDPIVARVGTHIVVAGGGWEFDGDPLAVEVFDPNTSSWRFCQPMPVTLKDSAPATSCLSVATNRREMFVTDKASGTTYAFDPEIGAWRGPFDLRPDPRVFSTAVGFVSGNGEEMIVVGLIGSAPGSVLGLGIWRVVGRPELLGGKFGFEMIGEAPEEIFERWLKEGGEDEEVGFDQCRSIGLLAAEGMVYVYDQSEPETVVFCELSSSSSRDCAWGSTRNLWLEEDAKVWRRVVFTCGRVEIGDLKRAITKGNRKFRVLES